MKERNQICRVIWYRKEDIHVSLFENFEYRQVLYDENKKRKEKKKSSTERKENKK